jgi:alpha-D-ribose 1-methylphosphonate 5-triphosphate synthase subunit PhnG
MRIEAGVGDLVQRIEDGQAQVGYSVAGRSRGRVTLCAVCAMHKEIRSADFLV